MSETLTERLTKTKEGMRLYQQERAILDVTELICQVMEDQAVNRSELATRIGKTKGYVTQLLDGRTNMTVRTMSDVFVALERAIHFQDGPLEATVNASPQITFNVSWLADKTPTWGENVHIQKCRRANNERLVG